MAAGLAARGRCRWDWLSNCFSWGPRLDWQLGKAVCVQERSCGMGMVWCNQVVQRRDVMIIVLAVAFSLSDAAPTAVWLFWATYTIQLLRLLIPHPPVPCLMRSWSIVESSARLSAHVLDLGSLLATASPVFADGVMWAAHRPISQPPISLTALRLVGSTCPIRPLQRVRYIAVTSIITTLSL